MHALVIDDHPLYRDGIAQLLQRLEPGCSVVGVSSVAEALGRHDSPSLDLILLDMNLPGAGRLAGLQQVREAFIDTTLVVISGEEDPELMLSSVDAGAAGFIPKSSNHEVTIQALRLVLAQGVYLPPVALQHARRRPSAAVQSSLSPKQTAVLQLLLKGKSNKLIARELDIAEGTVKAHLWAVYRGLGVSSRSQAMCRAYELGLLQR